MRLQARAAHRSATSGQSKAIRRCAAAWSWALLLFLNVPVLTIAVMSFARGPFLSFPPSGVSLHWYGAYLFSARWMSATSISLEVALAAALLATVLGTSAAFGLERRQYPLLGMARALVAAPLIVPGIVSAVAFYFFFARIGLVGTRTGLILADTVLAVPLVSVNVGTALRGIDRDLERAARGLGASPWRVFQWVTWPLLRPAIGAGFLLAFLLSFDELVVALFLSGVETTTLPVRLWNSLRDELDPTVAAASTLLIVVCIAVVALIEAFRGRGGPTIVPGGL